MTLFETLKAWYKRPKEDVPLPSQPADPLPKYWRVIRETLEESGEDVPEGVLENLINTSPYIQQRVLNVLASSNGHPVILEYLPPAKEFIRKADKERLTKAVRYLSGKPNNGNKYAWPAQYLHARNITATTPSWLKFCLDSQGGGRRKEEVRQEGIVSN
ncbi:hypothetical protein D6783_04525 [Candidatus Woesearchaeota archaeon]|nr:MAG: hypothetical protein D6783_04525 [Candidatus Woesearchaeota archaeon]